MNSTKKRCPNGFRKDKNGICRNKNEITQKKRCPKGTRKNKKGECVQYVKKSSTGRTHKKIEYTIIIMNAKTFQILKKNELNKKQTAELLRKIKEVTNIDKIQPKLPERIVKKIEDNLNLQYDPEDVVDVNNEYWYVKSDHLLSKKIYHVSFEGTEYDINFILEDELF